MHIHVCLVSSFCGVCEWASFPMCLFCSHSYWSGDRGRYGYKMFLLLTLLTCCSCVFCMKCSVRMLYSLMSARALCMFLQLYVIIMFYTWDPALRHILLLSAHTCTHIVSCTINALISFNYLLHQSFSSAISLGTVCLWGSPARPPAGLLHLISGLPVGSAVGAECLRAVHRITPRR